MVFSQEKIVVLTKQRGNIRTIRAVATLTTVAWNRSIRISLSKNRQHLFKIGKAILIRVSLTVLHGIPSHRLPYLFHRPSPIKALEIG